MSREIVQTQCPRCGAVRVTPEAITLVAAAPGVTPNRYSFSCPSCRHEVVRRAGVHSWQLLLEHGARLMAASPEPCPHEAPPFVPDDLIDFHQLLETADWFERLLQADTAPGTR